METNVFSISSLQLTNFGISSYLGGQIDETLISAPNLSFFHYCGPLTDYVFPLTLPSLHEVNFDIRIYVWTRGAAAKLIGMLQELQNVQFLTINWVIIEIISLLHSNT